MALSNSLCYHENGIKCELFRDFVSYMQVFCLRLSVPEKLLKPSEVLNLDLSFGKDSPVNAVIRIRAAESFHNSDKLPHRRNARIKRKDGNVRFVCSIPIHGKEPGHFIWKTRLFDIEVQVAGNPALVPILMDGHKHQ